MTIVGRASSARERVGMPAAVKEEEVALREVPEQVERVNTWLESFLKSGKGEY